MLKLFLNKYKIQIRSVYTIGSSHHFTSQSWANFFKEHVSAHSISAFNASHSYWLSGEVLLDSIIQMNQLEELCVQDTEISLTHLARIFEACPKLVNLSFSLREINLDRYQTDTEQVLKEVALLSQGFAKLTHLKIFCTTLDLKCCVESWLTTFGVLKYVYIHI